MTHPKRGTQETEKAVPSQQEIESSGPEGAELSGTELSETELNNVVGGKTQPSPKLMQFCATGEHIKRVNLT